MLCLIASRINVIDWGSLDGMRLSPCDGHSPMGVDALHHCGHVTGFLAVLDFQAHVAEGF